MQEIKNNKKAGFTLLISVIVTGILLLVSFIVADLALKQLLITSAGQQSQIAFYVADSGVECAQYWDLKGNGGVSSFATTTIGGSVTCNNNSAVSTLSNQTVLTSPTTKLAIIGGVESIKPFPDLRGVSLFMVTFANSSCAIVEVVKNVDNTTTINSYGYNTCDLTALRRFERGITVTY